eukprot:scaffold89565_cov27-Attheya_sp.AAC.1
MAYNGFHKELFNNRWYNQWTYQCEVQDLNFVSNDAYSSLINRNMSRYDKDNRNDNRDIVDDMVVHDDNYATDEIVDDDHNLVTKAIAVDDIGNDNNSDDEDFSGEISPNKEVIEDIDELQDPTEDEHQDPPEDNEEPQDHTTQSTQSNKGCSQQLLTQEDPFVSSYCWKPSSTSHSSSSSSSTEKITYNQIVANFQKMASMIQHDQKELCRVNNSIDNLVQRYRRHHTVEIIIRTVARKSNGDIVATTNMNPTATFCSRKRGFREHQEKNSCGKRRRIMNPTPSVASIIGQQNDDNHMSRVKSLKKPCKLCQQPGHRGFLRCPKILKYCQEYGKSPFPPKCSASRSTFVERLIKDNGIVSGIFEETDKRNICKSMPRNVTALILHKRLIRNDRVEKGRGALAIIMEVTFLGENGDPHSDYNQVLFELPVITKWILRSNSNILVSQLEEVLCKENTPSPKTRDSSKNKGPLREIDGNSLDYIH